MPSRAGYRHVGGRSPQAVRWLGRSRFFRRNTWSHPAGSVIAQDLAGTPQLNLGRKMMAQYGCVHCHTVKIPDGGLVTATDDPPSLSHIADKTTREWIYAWFKDPQAYPSTATMPNFRLSDRDARDISAFLIAHEHTSVAEGRPGLADPASQVKDDAALQKRRQSLRRIILRLLSRGAERGGQPGGRESRSGVDQGRHESETGLAASWASQSARLRSDTADAALSLYR